jgi:glycerol-3-phosphate dehydrogenase
VLPLEGGEMRDVDAEIARAVATTGDEALARRLVGAHGTEWHGIWSLTQADPALGGEVESGLPYRYAELLHAVTHEQGATLGDLLIRRTPVAFETRDHGRGAARRLAPSVARWLRWTREETEESLAAYEAEVTRLFRISPD